MIDIIKNLISCNYTKSSNRNIEYIVEHYTTSRSSSAGSALSSRSWFNNPSAQASAHYIVDDTSTIQAVTDNNIAWHCGTKNGYRHKYCRNSNSIGIEIASNHKDKKSTNILAEDRGWYFTDASISKAVELTRYLMDKYNIPEDHVLRHYDVTGKICPAPFVNNESEWMAFKKRLKGGMSVSKSELLNSLTDEDCLLIVDRARELLKNKDGGAWSEEDRQWAQSLGLVNGADGRMMWLDFLTREQMVTILRRLLDKLGFNSVIKIK